MPSKAGGSFGPLAPENTGEDMGYQIHNNRAAREFFELAGISRAPSAHGAGGIGC